MAGKAAIAATAVLLLAACAFAQDGSSGTTTGNAPTGAASPGTNNINKLVPEPLAAKVSPAPCHCLVVLHEQLARAVALHSCPWCHPCTVLICRSLHCMSTPACPQTTGAGFVEVTPAFPVRLAAWVDQQSPCQTLGAALRSVKACKQVWDTGPHVAEQSGWMQDQSCRVDAYKSKGG